MTYINTVIENIYNTERVYGYILAMVAVMMFYSMLNSYGFIAVGYAGMFVVSAWLALACLRIIKKDEK
jgi:hypothetical protein